MRILYVEDDQRDADLLRRELAKATPQIQLDHASTKADALTRLAQDAGYDLALLDLHLPDGDGLTLLAHIRARGLPLAVVILTAYGDEETTVAALRAGADDYVPKRAGYLARLPSALEDALARYRDAAARRARPLRALYVEHRATDIELTRRHFARYAPQISLDVVYTADEALARFPSARGMASPVPTPSTALPYDVLLLDYRLPGITALEAIKELRQVRGLDVPVVLVTGQGNEETALEALKLGATDYLPKYANYLNHLPLILENAFHRVEAVREQIRLRESAARLKKAQALGRIGDWEYDIQRQTLTWSDEMYVLYGRDPALGPPTIEEDAAHYAPQQLHVLLEYARRATEEGESFEYDLEVQLPNGQTTNLAASVHPLKDRNNQITRLFGTVQDITERKTEAERLERLVTELARSNAELERFAYVASHDLQEPLRMVASFVQLLAERYRGQLDADADEFIGFAVEGAKRMQQLLLDLLEFSRVGTRGRQFEPTDCEGALAQIERALGEEIAAAQAQITHDPLPTLAADRAQLAQLFSHLIFNALKFRRADPPRVHVSAELRNADFRLQIDETLPQIANLKSEISNLKSVWVFSVRDNGIGIEPQYYERIFGVFQRLNSRRTYQGNGIGLAICKKIVERHGGRIWVESQVGQGSTFYFTLPAA